MNKKNKLEWWQDVFNHQKWQDKWSTSNDNKSSFVFNKHPEDIHQPQYKTLDEVTQQKPFIDPQPHSTINGTTQVTSDSNIYPNEVLIQKNAVNSITHHNFSSRIIPSHNSNQRININHTSEINLPKWELPHSNNNLSDVAPVVNQNVVQQQNLLSSHNTSINTSQNFYQPILRHNFNRKKIVSSEFNNLVPKPIAHEIRAEKWSSILIAIVSLIAFLGSVLFATCYFYGIYVGVDTNNKIIGIPFFYVPNGYFLIFIMVFALSVFLIKIFNLRQIIHEADQYFWKLKSNIDQVPNFILENYKKIEIRKIIFNWIGFATYILGLVIIGILLFLNQYKGQEFRIGFWSLGTIKNLNSELLVTTWIIITIFTLHIFNIVLAKKRKANLVGYYGYEIVSYDDIQKIKKKTNRICLIIFFAFIVLLFIIIMLPILLTKRRKYNKWVWPWSNSITN